MSADELPAALTMREAERRGYVSVTMAYTRHEMTMLAASFAAMRGADAVLVRVGGGIEIWRAKGQVRED